MRSHLITALAAASLLLTTAPAVSVAGPDDGADRQSARATDDLRLYSPAEEPMGLPMELWHARYLEWFQEIPVKMNPAVDPDSSRNCDVLYKVVMLGPAGTGQGCTVASDRPLALSFLGWSCSTLEGNGRAWRKLRRCARANFVGELSDVQVKMRLDGRLIEEPRTWTVTSSRRVITFPEDNIWGVSAGRTRMLGLSLFYLFRPLKPGKHVIRAKLRESGELSLLVWKFTVV